MNCRWFSALIFLWVELLCSGPAPTEKLTIWPNCSLYTETRKAKWIQFGWQSLSEELHLSEHGSQVNTFWLAMLTWSAVFKWKQPYAAEFGMQTLLIFFTYDAYMLKKEGQVNTIYLVKFDLNA